VVLDRRINAVRGDVADIALAGTLFAPHYACPMTQSCILPSTPLRERADDSSPLVSELLYGEAFEVLDLNGEWAWGYCAADHYVGYVRQDALAAARNGEWRVAVPKALAALGGTLFMGSPIGGSVDGDRVETPLGAIPLSDLTPGDAIADPVEVAERLLGCPYLLGGRTADGIDCSGLVQLAYALAGVALQRDSDLQAATAGVPLAPGDRPQRGDLAFFPGHVGMMIDGERMIHATAHSGNVTIEPLADVEARTTTAQVRRP
jgi:hypothetical protein